MTDDIRPAPDEPPDDEGGPDIKTDPVTEPDDGDGEAPAGVQP